MIIYKWPAGQKNLAADYHLKADSPAIGSADSSVQRGRDMDGHGPAEAASASKTAAADVKLLDRGAFEFVPASPHGLSK